MSLSSTLGTAKKTLGLISKSQVSWLRGIERISAKKQEMVFRALSELRPRIIQALRQSWVNSGLPQGRLYEAAVENPSIIISSKGIRIGLQAGLGPIDNKSGKSRYNIYIQAASLQYGSVRGGEASARLKKKIKTKQLEAHGLSIVSAHPFYLLNDGQVAELQRVFNLAMQRQINEVAAQK